MLMGDDDGGDGDDSSSSSSYIEDVTDQYMDELQRKIKERQPIKVLSSDDSGDEEEKEVEDVSTDDEYTDFEDDNDENENSSYGEKENEQTHGNTGNNNKKKTLLIGSVSRKRKLPVAANTAPDSPLKVLMDEKDMPTAPGTQSNPTPPGTKHSNLEENSTLQHSSSSLDKHPNTDQTVKNRIIKLLNTGFHEKSNENEAKNAMKLAQRLMTKHNLSQALLLQEHDAAGNDGSDQILKGGMVNVRIINRKTRKPALLARWISHLMDPISKNFAVESFYSTARGRRCTVTFYGIYTNCQLAGYAFRIATERIAQMTAAHNLVTTKRRNRMSLSPSTKSSRLSYALGIVKGITQEVNDTLRRDIDKRQQKLVQARLAKRTGEAYEESENDDDSNDNDNRGGGYSFPSVSVSMNNSECNNDHLSSSICDHDEKKPLKHLNKIESNTKHCKTQTLSTKPLTGEALNHRLEEMKNEEQAALVLVDHREKVAKQVLEENKIKITKGARRKPISFDRQSYEKGIEDSKEIDINQRAIRDKIRTKKEEQEKRC